MKSRPSYSWAIKQTNAKKVHSLMDKCRYRQKQLIMVMDIIKVNDFPITDDFIKSTLNQYLYEHYRWGLFCAVWRNIEGIFPLISENIWDKCTFERYLTGERSDCEYYTKEFNKHIPYPENKK